MPRRKLWGDSVALRPDDRRIPGPIRKLSPFLVSSSRAPFRLTTPQQITFAQALYGGEYWSISFASEGLSGPLVALSHAISPDMRLRAPSAPVVVPFEDPFVQRVASRVPRRWADTLEESEPRKLQLASGTFPNDATTVVVVSMPDELSEQSAMFTAKADQTLVHELAVPEQYSGPAGITIEFIADLDGDGFDEVGWSEQDIESYRSVVTHLTATGVEHRTISFVRARGDAVKRGGRVAQNTSSTGAAESPRKRSGEARRCSAQRRERGSAPPGIASLARWTRRDERPFSSLGGRPSW